MKTLLLVLKGVSLGRILPACHFGLSGRHPGWLALALVLLSGCATQGQIDESENTTGELGREQRKSPAELYVNLGVAYWRNGQTAVALQKLNKAIAVDPEYAQAHNVIALIYQRLGETERAGEHYAQAVRLDPKDPDIRNARGTYLCTQEKYDLAEIEFENALGNPLYPTPWVALTNAGLCAERAGAKEKAETYYRRALTANSTYPQALYQMIEISLEQGNPLSARGYLERYNGVSAATAGSLWLGVQIERRLGDYRRANEYRTQLLKRFPDTLEIQLLKKSERE